MHSGRLLRWRSVGFAFVFSQLMEHLPAKAFRRCVRRYGGDRHVQSFTCLDQFLCLAFAQLTHRESLRDIEVCLRAHREKLYHMGIRGGMARNTLANANRKRDWRIHADFAQALIRIARPLYAGEDLGLELDNTVYALDSSTVDLCLSVFPWALFRSTKSGVKLHTLLDLRGNIPAFIHISEAKLHDVNVLDLLVPEPVPVREPSFPVFRSLNRVVARACAFSEFLQCLRYEGGCEEIEHELGIAAVPDPQRLLVKHFHDRKICGGHEGDRRHHPHRGGIALIVKKHPFLGHSRPIAVADLACQLR